MVCKFTDPKDYWSESEGIQYAVDSCLNSSVGAAFQSESEPWLTRFPPDSL